jgi:transcriptional regulator GlxA family with amidase domain
MKHIYLFFLLIALSTGMASAQTDSTADAVIYVCGPCNNECDKLQFTAPGVCPHCNMKLIKTTVSEFKKQQAQQPVSICFYLYDGIELLDFAGPMEVFTKAGFKVFTVSKTKAPIKAQGILTITPEYSIADAPQADILAVFGGNTAPVESDPDVIGWIKSRKASTKSYLSVCTGSFILGRAGLLDGLTVTTFHTQIELMQYHFPKTKVLANTRFVDNGDVITTAGISAGIDGALHLVEKLRGRDFAKGIATTIEYDKWVPEDGLIISKK